MASVHFLAVLAEFVGGGVDVDFVVAGLEGDGFTVWVGRGADHAEHVGFGNVFDGDGDVEFPRAQGFVVGGGDEAAGLVDEGDGVDGAEVVVVFLGELAGAGVVLDDFLVRHAGEEGGRVVRVRVPRDTVRDLARREARVALARFCIPEFHVAVIRGGDELRSRGVEGDVVDGAGVAGIGAEELSLVEGVPDFDFAVCGGGEEKVA